jgi:hypothetical protein
MSQPILGELCQNVTLAELLLSDVHMYTERRVDVVFHVLLLIGSFSVAIGCDILWHVFVQTEPLDG